MNYLKYLKYGGIFIILEVMISFIVSLLNLMGVNSGITSIILLIINSIIFFFFTYKNGTKTKKNGYVMGILMGLYMIMLMFIISTIMSGFKFQISTFIYYLILLFISGLGGMVGINHKKEDKN